MRSCLPGTQLPSQSCVPQWALASAREYTPKPERNFIFRDFRTRARPKPQWNRSHAARFERLAGLGFFYPFRLPDTSSRQAELQEFTFRPNLAHLPAPLRRRRRSRSVGFGRALPFRRGNELFERNNGSVQAAALSFELGQNTWKVHRGISPRSPRIFPYGVKKVRLCTFCSVFRTNLETSRFSGTQGEKQDQPPAGRP